MDKKELILHVANLTGAHPAKVAVVVEATLGAIANELSFHNEVRLKGFGKFSCQLRRPRVARNFKTGKALDVPAHFKVTFKPSKSLNADVR